MRTKNLFAEECKVHAALYSAEAMRGGAALDASDAALVRDLQVVGHEWQRGAASRGSTLRQR